MEAKVQILDVDRVNHNGRFYPRSVVQKAIQNLQGQPLDVIHVRAFLDSNGCPKVSDSLGVAKDLRLDDETGMVLADVKIDHIPDDLKGGYVIASAGFGDVQNGTVVDFTFTGVVVARE